MVSYTLLARDGAARRGRIDTPHGPLETPVFMPVGTAATVKTLEPRDLVAADARIILGNTYHLFLRPGHERIRRLGGLHRFMAWDGALLTDSGGFQVFSLGSLRGPEGADEAAEDGARESLVKIGEEGVWFQSHLDGQRHFLSPERAIEIQEALGADVVMAFDECPPALAERSYHEASLARTQRWLVRCRDSWREAEGKKGELRERAVSEIGHGSPLVNDVGPLHPCALFGIAQGGMFADLRQRAIEDAAALELPGYALGGYAVGEAPEEMWAGVARDAPLLPEEKPRYLMGVGMPEDLLHGIAAGIDMFDCVLPTRCARNGLLFTSRGRLTIRNARWADDDRPADPSCTCPTCRTFSRAYLRHLFKSGELLGLRLNTLHNVHFFLGLMSEARRAIAEGRFSRFMVNQLDAWRAGPE